MSQFDLKNVFLYEDEEVYMSIPLGYEKTWKCYTLKKALQDLKQSSRSWFEGLKNFINKHRYHQGNDNHTTLFIKSNEGKVAIFLSTLMIRGRNSKKEGNVS